MRGERSVASSCSVLSFLLFSFISIRETIYGRSWRQMRIASVERRFLGVGVSLLLLSLLSASGVYGVLFWWKYPVVGLHLIDIIWAQFSNRSTVDLSVS